MPSDRNSSSNSFRLLDLPSEIIARVGSFATSNRLAFPTGALNRYLKSIFSDPVDIVARAIAHYPSPEHALVAESSIGNVEIVRILVAQVHVNRIVVVNNVKYFALSEAAKNNRLCAARCLLDAGADANGQFGAPLAKACAYGHTHIIELLLERGADLDKYGAACLLVASRKGHLDIMHLLINRGVTHPKTLTGALIQALAHDRLDTADLLVSRGAILNCKTVGALKLMEHAVERGNLGTVAHLYSRDADFWSLEGRPLIAAAYYGNVDIVRYLLVAGADVHVQNEDALVKAVVGGHDEVVRMLLAKGAHVDPVRQVLQRMTGEEEFGNVLAVLDRCQKEAGDPGAMWGPYIRRQ